MAKKPKLNYNLACSCTINVPETALPFFLSDLSRGELSLRASLSTGAGNESYVIYPDQVKGEFVFEKIDEFNYRISVSGRYTADDDFDLASTLRELPVIPKLILDCVGDHHGNSYYIGADKSKVVQLGELKL